MEEDEKKRIRAINAKALQDTIDANREAAAAKKLAALGFKRTLGALKSLHPAQAVEVSEQKQVAPKESGLVRSAAHYMDRVKRIVHRNQGLPHRLGWHDTLVGERLKKAAHKETQTAVLKKTRPSKKALQAALQQEGM